MKLPASRMSIMALLLLAFRSHASRHFISFLFHFSVIA
jgi:hypothetical protein